MLLNGIYTPKKFTNYIFNSLDVTIRSPFSPEIDFCTILTVSANIALCIIFTETIGQLSNFRHVLASRR